MISSKVAKKFRSSILKVSFLIWCGGWARTDCGMMLTTGDIVLK